MVPVERRPPSTGGELTRLYEQHAAEVFRFALHLTGRRADAEDIVQQVFLRAHRHLESGRELRERPVVALDGSQAPRP